MVAWILATNEPNESEKKPRSPTWHITADATQLKTGIPVCPEQHPHVLHLSLSLMSCSCSLHCVGKKYDKSRILV